MKSQLYKIFATGFGAGYFPFAPGTVGTGVAIVIYWVINYFFPSAFAMDYFDPFFILMILIFFIIGIISGDHLEQIWGKDPGRIVIDEMVGMWVVLLGLDFSWTYILMGFFLFRFFDILKPLYINKLQNLPGGWGIMLDDVLAGLYTNVFLRVFLLFNFNGWTI